MISLLMVPSACRVMLSLGLISCPSLYLRHEELDAADADACSDLKHEFSVRIWPVLPHNLSIVCRDVAEQHHRVQLHAALMELLLWERLELHRRTWKISSIRNKDLRKYSSIPPQHTCHIHVKLDDISRCLTRVNSSVRRVSCVNHDPPHVAL